MSIAALLVSGALVLAQEVAPPQTGTADVPDLPVSLDRIREGLERPAGDRLRLRVVIPDFAVKVVERERFEKLVPPWDFRSGPVPPGGLYAYDQLQRAGLRAFSCARSRPRSAESHSITRAKPAWIAHGRTPRPVGHREARRWPPGGVAGPRRRSAD